MKSLYAIALLGALAGCNTMEGLGRDLAAGGEAIEGAASDAQQPAPQPQRPIYQPVPQQQPIYRQPVAPYNPNTPAPTPNSNYVY